MTMPSVFSSVMRRQDINVIGGSAMVLGSSTIADLPIAYFKSKSGIRKLFIPKDYILFHLGNNADRDEDKANG